MTAPARISLAVAVALALAACGGGDDEAATTTSAPAESTTTSVQPTTTTIDPALQQLLLVAADLEGFKEQPGAPPVDEASTAPICGDQAVAPAGAALRDEPFADGPTLVRGAEDAVEVSSSALKTTAERAESALNEIVDPKVVDCLEADFKTEAEKNLPAGSTVTLESTATKSTVTGVDQAVLVTSTSTVKSEARTVATRVDLVFLREEGTILTVNYLGPTALTSNGERQRIVAIAARKLAGPDAAGTSTTTGGSSTSSRQSTTSSRRSTSTTGAGTTSSRRSTTSTTT